MKKIIILISTIMLVVVMGGCGIKNPFSKSSADTTSTSAQQNASNTKDTKATATIDERLQQLETKYSLERKNLERDRNLQDDKELKSFNDNIDINAKTVKKEYEDKISALNKSNQDKLKKDLTIELNRIKAEFENEKKKIEAEYTAEKARNSQTGTTSSTANSPEKNRANKLYEAEQQKAEKERNANNNYALNLEVQSKVYESQLNQLNNIWAEYDAKIKSAKDQLNSSKQAIKTKTNLKYDNSMAKLKTDAIAVESMWQNIPSNEDEEIKSLWKVEEDKYENLVKEICTWRDNQLKSVI